MDKLTEHQSDALERFPDGGWHRVDMSHYPASWAHPKVWHPEATAHKLAEKGYFEERLTGHIPGYIWSGYFEFRKIN